MVSASTGHQNKNRSNLKPCHFRNLFFIFSTDFYYILPVSTKYPPHLYVSLDANQYHLPIKPETAVYFKQNTIQAVDFKQNTKQGIDFKRKTKKKPSIAKRLDVSCNNKNTQGVDILVNY